MKQTSFYITLHLIADTPEELSAMTVAAQLDWGMTIDFFDFTRTPDGKYMCWYKMLHTKWMEAMIGEA